MAVDAQDTDVLVLLVHHWLPHMASVYMVCERCCGSATQIINVQTVQEKLGLKITKRLFVLHAVSG